MAQFHMTDPKTPNPARKGDSLAGAAAAADRRNRADPGAAPPRVAAGGQDKTRPDPALRCLDFQHNPAADTRPADAHQADGKSPDHQAC